MTQKEVTNFLYSEITNPNRIDIVNINGINYFIYKSSIDENYMVCVLNETNDCYHSNVVTTITECHEWITQNS